MLDAFSIFPPTSGITANKIIATKHVKTLAGREATAKLIITVVAMIKQIAITPTLQPARPFGGASIC